MWLEVLHGDAGLALAVQLSGGDVGDADWEPRFADYLYVSFTNATAFSPTDTMPLSRRAKLAMMLQSAVALATVVMVLARAINIPALTPPTRPWAGDRASSVWKRSLSSRPSTPAGIEFRSHSEGLHTDGPMGIATLTIMAAFAQLERATMIERTQAGLAAAAADGGKGGCSQGLSDASTPPAPSG